MTSVYRWSPADKARLLACTSEAEMTKAFPGKTLGNLLRRRTEFSAESRQTGPVRSTVKTKLATIEPRSQMERSIRNAFADTDLFYTPPRLETSSWSPSAKDKVKGPTTTHVVIPDTQAGPGRPTDHLRWIGQYIVDQFSNHENVKVIHLGDHADMPSLSSYDRGKKSMENRRVMDDIAAANSAFIELNKPLEDHNRGLRKKWWPERHIILGNHEDRITRAIEDDAQIDGLLSLDLLNYAEQGWDIHPFLKPHFIDGIGYAHYWANPMSGKPYGGMMATRLKTLGFSFTMGHQQLLDYAIRFVAGKSQHGLVAGACYLHDEDYKGYQGNAHWRGIVVCHDVRDGQYDPMFVSLGYLCRRYEGVEIETFLKKKYKMSYNGGW